MRRAYKDRAYLQDNKERTNMSNIVMDRWPYILVSYTPQQVREYCVQDSIWQIMRMSLKGLDTHDKLKRLHSYYIGGYTQRYKNAGASIPTKLHIDIQVSNYINALKRGGQLNVDTTIKRVR